MKKIIAVIIAGLIMLQAGTVAYARSQPTVYLHAPSVITSELSEVSVRIKDNSGLMGIKLSVEYPAAQVDVRSIAKGEALRMSAILRQILANRSVIFKFYGTIRKQLRQTAFCLLSKFRK